MILLCGSLKSYCQNNSSTGGLDSVYVSYDDLRKANIKMVQLKYANQKIQVKDSIIKVDSAEIETLKIQNNNINKQTKKIKIQRNILTFISTGLLGVIIGILL